MEHVTARGAVFCWLVAQVSIGGSGFTRCVTYAEAADYVHGGAIYGGFYGSILTVNTTEFTECRSTCINAGVFSAGAHHRLAKFPC